MKLWVNCSETPFTSYYHLLDFSSEFFSFQTDAWDFYFSNSLISDQSNFPHWLQRTCHKTHDQRDCKAQSCQAALPKLSTKEMHWLQTLKESRLKNQDVKRQSHWHTPHMKAIEGLNKSMKSLLSLVILWSTANQPHKELYDVLQGPGQEMWVDIYFNQTWNDPAIFPSALSVS